MLKWIPTLYSRLSNKRDGWNKHDSRKISQNFGPKIHSPPTNFNFKCVFSRPAEGRPRPKVTIMAQAYTLQSIWHIFHQNIRSPILHTKVVFLLTIWHIFHQNLRSPILLTKEVFLQTIWHVFHQNLCSSILHTKEIFFLIWVKFIVKCNCYFWECTDRLCSVPRKFKRLKNP